MSHMIDLKHLWFNDSRVNCRVNMSPQIRNVRICRACRNLWLPDYLIPPATKRSAGRHATSLENDLSHVDRPHDLTKWHRRCSSTILRSAATNILKKPRNNYHCLMKKSAQLWVSSLFFFPDLQWLRSAIKSYSILYSIDGIFIVAWSLLSTIS